MTFTTQTKFIQVAIQWSSIALLYYDYALTFSSEVELVWRDKTLFKISTLVYVLCRYALLGNVLYLLAIGHKLGSNCDTWYKIIGAFSVLGRGAVIFTFLMRTYVVCAKRKSILFSLGTLGAAILVCNVVHIHGSRCTRPSTTQTVNSVLSVLVCVFEASATLLTVLRSVRILRFGGGKFLVNGYSLNRIVFENDLLYFGLVSFFTIGGTVLSFRAPAGFFQRLLNALTLPLSGMLTARFILRVRAYSTSPPPGDAASDVSSVRFASHTDTNPGVSMADEFGVDPADMTTRFDGPASDELEALAYMVKPGRISYPLQSNSSSELQTKKERAAMGAEVEDGGRDQEQCRAEHITAYLRDRRPPG